MGDLKSKRWIVAKGVMFLAIIVLAGGAAWLEAPSLRMLILLGTLVWASARFYYFLFYVLEHYVDQRMKYAGILSLLQAIASQQRHGDQEDDRDGE